MSLEVVENTRTGTSHAVVDFREDLIDALVQDRLLTLEQARLIGEQQRIVSANGRQRDIIELVLENGFVNKSALSKTLSRLGAGLSAELQLLLPREMCHRHQIIPINRLEFEGKAIIVIETARFFSQAALLAIEEEASKHCACPISIWVVAATQARMDEAIRKLAGKTNGVAEAIRELELDPENGSRLKTLVHEMLMEAVSLRSSDAHFDCVHERAQQCFVSYRIDGVLKRMHLLPAKIMLSILRTLKTQADMDASDTRSFQDGRMDFNFQNRQIDMRVHTNAMSGGEYMVIRFLDRESLRSLEDLMPYHPDITRELSALSHNRMKQSGLLLVTGPTGSGKTTTLYALIMAMPREVLNVMTIEDPVEFAISFVKQIAFNSRIYKSFADLMPSLLRSDPNIVIVGELRDEATAEAATRIAESGHLVMATLHTNDALQTPERLFNMSAPGTRHIAISTFANTVKGIVNQTLLPVLCDHCATSPDAKTIEAARKWFGPAAIGAAQACVTGCPHCVEGFKPGRVVLPEAIFFDTSTDAKSHLSTLLLAGNSLGEALRLAPELARVYPRQSTLMPLVQRRVVDIHDALKIVGADMTDAQTESQTHVKTVGGTDGATPEGSH
jgi:type II secretory ATPase GspE/PulE/Tfp pilus assembly ATPase PilB-like protein